MSAHSQRIERYLQRHPGSTIAEARGHGKTPERPGHGKGQERFQDYYEKRAELERQVVAKKRRLFGSSPKYREDRSARAVQNSKVALSHYDDFLADDFDTEDIDSWDDADWIWYH